MPAFSHPEVRTEYPHNLRSPQWAAAASDGQVEACEFTQKVRKQNIKTELRQT